MFFGKELRGVLVLISNSYIVGLPFALSVVSGVTTLRLANLPEKLFS